MKARLAIATEMAGTLRRRTGASLILAAVSYAHAQGAAEPEAPEASIPVQVVEVRLATKNPAMMPYRKAYDLLAKVDPAGTHRLHAVFRVTSPRSHQAVPDLRVAIEGENTHLRVNIAESGLIELPFDQAAYADDADLVANKPKEALDVGFFVVPELPSGTIRYADLAESVSAARAAIARIVPWYIRWVTPTIQGIGLCYPDDGHRVSIDGVPDAARPAREPDLDVAGNKVFCARFSAAEALTDKDRVLVAPDGWEAIFW
jgi:hypothetical protein